MTSFALPLGVVLATALVACGGPSGSSKHPKAPREADDTTDVRDDSDTSAADASAPSASSKVIPVGDVPAAITAMTGKILKRASIARRLDVKEPVKLEVLAPAKLVAVVKKQVADEVPRGVIAGEGHALAALGLVPEGYDYEAESYALLEEQLAGLYIPDAKTMYLSAAIERDEVDGTLAHELVHALQDQHFGIGARMKYRPDASDALGAIQSLAEGDATSAMFDEMILARGGPDALTQHTALELPDQDPEEMMSASEGDKHKSKKLASSPRFIAVGLLAPYADGLRFVHGLRRRGGWSAVNEAWARPPVSGEQLLHLDKFDTHEPSIVVPVASAAALGAGWTLTFDDVLGEQEARIAFSEWMDVPTAKRAVAGWGGDHLSLYESGGKRAVAWRMVFDTNDDARDAFASLAAGWRARFGGASADETSASYELVIFGGPASATGDKKKGDIARETREKREKSEKTDKKKPAAPGLPELPESGSTTSTPRSIGDASTPSTGPSSTPTTTKPTGPSSTLPSLPDGSTAAPASTSSTPKPIGAAPSGCRAIRIAGRAVTVVAGAPCDSTGRWSEEVGKAP